MFEELLNSISDKDCELRKAAKKQQDEFTQALNGMLALPEGQDKKRLLTQALGLLECSELRLTLQDFIRLTIQPLGDE